MKHSYKMDLIVLINSFITCVTNTEFNWLDLKWEKSKTKHIYCDSEHLNTLSWKTSYY